MALKCATGLGKVGDVSCAVEQLTFGIAFIPHSLAMSYESTNLTPSLDAKSRFVWRRKTLFVLPSSRRH